MRDEYLDWRTSVFRDLQDVEKAWASIFTSSDKITGVLHVGFWRPSTEDLDQIISGCQGFLLLTQAARFSLPLSHTRVGRQVGVVDSMPVYEAISGWGYEATSAAEQESGSSLDADHSSVASDHLFEKEYLSKQDWVSAISVDKLALHRDAGSHGVTSEATYLSLEASLPERLRESLGWERYLYYVGLLPSADIILDTLKFSPPWFLDKRIPALSLSNRSVNALTARGVSKVRDFLPLGLQGVSTINNLGFKSQREISSELVNLLARGPWLQATDESRLAIASRHSLLEMDPSDPMSSSTKSSPRSIKAAKPSIASVPAESLRQLLEECPKLAQEQHQNVVRLRMGFDGVGRTLEQIGSEVGVTRERIRQIEANAVRRIKQSPQWCADLEARLCAVLDVSEVPVAVAGLEAADPWFAGAADLQQPLRFALRNFIDNRVSMLEIDGLPTVCRITSSEWESARHKGREMVSGMAGSGVTEEQVRIAVESILPPRARELQSTLWLSSSKNAHFSDHPEGRQLVSFGIGVDHAVQAVLSESETPLHYSEIRDICARRLGKDIELSRAHNAAVSVGLLYGRGTYGLEKHNPLTEDDSASIIEAVEDFVEKGPATKQWHASDFVSLVSEIDLDSELIVNSYLISLALRRSERLVSLGRMVWALKASGAVGVSNRIDVRQAVISVLQDAGRPLTAHEVRGQLTRERGLNSFFQIPQGGSLIRVSKGVWGLVERDVPLGSLEIESAIEALKGNLIRRQKGIHESEIIDIVRHAVPSVSPTTDPMLIMELAQREGSMSIARGQILFLSIWEQPRRLTLLQAVREALVESGADGLGLDELHVLVEEKLERSISRALLPACCDDVAEYSYSTQRWIPLP